MSFPSGVYSALVTPMTEQGKVDYDSLNNLVSYQLKEGVTGLVIFGTTGEAPTIEDDEFIDVMEFVYRICANKVFVVAGVTGNCTKFVVDKCALVEKSCDAFMITVPYYNKPDQKGIFNHFKTVFDSYPDKPMMLYNVPGRAVVSISPETIGRLVNECDNLGALKEASGKLDTIIALNRMGITDRISVFAGDDGMHVPMYSFGAKGVISVVSNFDPAKIVSLWKMLEEEKIKDASTEYAHNIDKLVKKAFKYPNPVPSKSILENMGIISYDIVRLPLVPLTRDEKKELHDDP